MLSLLLNVWCIGNSLGVRSGFCLVFNNTADINYTQQIVEGVHKCCLGLKVKDHVNSMPHYIANQVLMNTLIQYIDSNLSDKHNI